MSNDAEARQVHTTATDSEEPADRPDPAGEDGEMIDPDAIIIAGDPDDLDDDDLDEAELDEAEDDGHPDTVVAQAIVVEPVPADDAIAEPVPASAIPAEPVAASAAGPKHAAADTGPARPGMPMNGDVPKGSPMAGDPDRLHQRWAAIQSTFVDDPRGSVTSAADMMTEVIATVVASAKERESGLRGEWDRDGVDTESLRNALRSYRSLLDQLAAI